ncbi:hypothetical protein Slala02_64360 [Streptomyces lavendulae subsp. lavendulae]|nr:hypothetical protein Slala01_67970 [Streptomyces lavendulae subsp. lavendulae]GLX30616.1 hypothetical protein Slala02_64360 [Streptomyces lavendulae subsp. lavendulae]
MLVLRGAGPRSLAVLGSLRIAARERPGTGGLLVELVWPAGLRGMAASFGGVAHHAVLHSSADAECGCVRHDCGGVTPRAWFPDHGPAAGQAPQDHIEGGIYCTDRAASRHAATRTESPPTRARAPPYPAEWPSPCPRQEPAILSSSMFRMGGRLQDPGCPEAC